jgi:hypothetical protein
MYGFTNGQLLGGPIKNLYDFVEKNGTAPDIKTRVDVLAITPTTGVVRVGMERDEIGADFGLSISNTVHNHIHFITVRSSCCPRFA